MNTPTKQLDKIRKAVKYSEICRDFYTGSLNVINEKYIPKWRGESDEGYNARIKGTPFYSAYRTVIDSLTGLITQKEAKVNGYEYLDIEDVDLKGNDIQKLIKDVTKYSLIDGIVFVSAEKNTESNRIYLKIYRYKNLITYRVKENKLQMLAFRDDIEVADGEYGVKTISRYIVFRENGGEVWYSRKDGDDVTKQEEWSNSLGGLSIVPIVVGEELSDFEVLPKLADIAEINRVHLNQESNLANIVNVVANPIPVFYGKIEEGKLSIGARDGLVFSDKRTEGFEYVEVTGAGVGKIQEKIKSVEENIDKLTFNLLKSKSSKTVIEAESSQRKNTSFLSDVAIELESKFNNILEIWAKLENKNVSEDDNIDFKKEFDTALVNIQTAKELLLAGEMSRETFYHVLATGELPRDFDIEKEAERIEGDASMGVGDATNP